MMRAIGDEGGRHDRVGEGGESLSMSARQSGMPTRGEIEASVHTRFTTSQRFVDCRVPGDVMELVPFFKCPGISSDATFQTALKHLTTELADMLMHRDLMMRKGELAAFNQMNCPIFRATRGIVSWVMAARDIVSMNGPFHDSVETYAGVVKGRLPTPDGKRFPTSNILLVIVCTAFAVREELTAVKRQVGEVPQFTTDEEAILKLTGVLWRARRLDGPVSYDELTQDVRRVVEYDRAAFDSLYGVGKRS